MMRDEKPTSIWKKEMAFRRKSAEEQTPDESAEAESPSDRSPTPAQSSSLWKKEFSLRKKPKDAPHEPEAVAVGRSPARPQPTSARAELAGARAGCASSRRLPVLEPARAVEPARPRSACREPPPAASRRSSSSTAG